MKRVLNLLNRWLRLFLSESESVPSEGETLDEGEGGKRQFDWISLGVFPLNKRARAFYAKSGYDERFLFLGKSTR